MLWKTCRRFTQLDFAAELDSRIYIRRDKRREEEWERCLLQPASPSQSECNWKAKQWNNERFAVWRKMSELFFALFSSCHTSWEESVLFKSHLCRNSLCCMTLKLPKQHWLPVNVTSFNLKSSVCGILTTRFAQCWTSDGCCVSIEPSRRRKTDHHWMILLISF